MDAITMVGFAAGTLTTLSFLPQVLKTYRSKRCDDLSTTMLAAFFSGVLLWLIFGLALKSAPIIVTNSVTLALIGAMLVMKLRYQGAAPGKGSGDRSAGD